MRAVSLFSGAGGLDIGATAAGLKVVACIENEEDCVATLKKNAHFSKTKIFCEDINKFNFKKLRGALTTKKGEPLVVIGGPPCQPFSKNGYWIKNENRHVDKDPRNLIGEFFRGVEDLGANGFMLENVESLAHPTNSHMLKYIIDRADTKNYKTQILHVNAADYGVPQRRKRIFIFGYKNKKPPSEPPLRTHSDSTDGSGADLPPHEGVRKFMVQYEGREFREEQEDASKGTYYIELQNVPPGKNYIHLASLNGYGGRSFKPGSRFWNFLLKLHPDLPSWTIAAQPGPWVGPFHWKNRRLRVPEIAAIQTFPDGYRFAGNRRSIQKQIGNAVPPLLAEHMVRYFMEGF